MKLTEEQKNNLMNKLNENWIPPKSCSVCGHNEWEVSDMLFEVREFHGGNMVIGGQSSIIPVIPTTCKYCGSVLFFNAIKIGIISK